MNGRGIRILSIADDDGIRFSRELVLRQEGYEVESVTSNARFDSPWVRTFPIAVLCHSVDSNRAAEIAEALRQRNPSIAVVRIHAIRSIRDFYYDVDCEALPGPISSCTPSKILSRASTPEGKHRRVSAHKN